jgi:cbb3-type cytochrome oxidase subunit 1
MKGISAWFFGSALIYALVGLLFGLVVNPIGGHNQIPTHAHLLEIGWVSFAIFAFFYHLFPERAATALATLHFWVAELSLIVLTIGFYLLYAGFIPVGEPIAVVASIGYLLSMLIFVLVALPAVRSAP